MQSVHEHPAALLRKGVKALQSGGLASDVIRALETVAFTNVNAAPLAGALKKADKLPLVDPAERVRIYELACRIWSPWRKQPQISATEDQRPQPSESTKRSTTGASGSDVCANPDHPEWNDMIERAAAFVAERTQWQVGQEDRFKDYSSFSFAWELSEYLQKDFESGDPGRVIGKYIDAIFNVSRLADPNLGIYIGESPRTTVAEPLLIRVLELLGSSEDAPGPERNICRFIADHKRDAAAGDKNFAAQHTLRCLGALLRGFSCPQQLMTALLLAIEDWGAFLTAPEPGAALSNFLYYYLLDVFLLCSPPYADVDYLRKRRVPYAECVGTSDLLERIASNKLDGEALDADLIESAKEMFLSLNMVVVSAFDAVIQARESEVTSSVLPPQLLPRFLSFGSHTTFDNYEHEAEFLNSHVAGGSRYRTDVLDGAAPFALEDAYLFWHAISHVSIDPSGRIVDVTAPCLTDLAYMLCQVKVHFGDSEDDDPYVTCLPSGFGQEYAEDASYWRRRAADYEILYRLALRDGLPELASAIQAFFVYSHALRYNGRVGPWDLVHECLSEALELDSRGMVVRAVRIAIEIARSHKQDLYVARLQGVLERRHPTSETVEVESPVTMPGLGQSTREGILRALQDQIGPARMARWSIGARELLIDATAKHLAQMNNMLYGTVQNWGTTATDFMKVFEAEIGARLKSVYLSESYREFKCLKKPAHYTERPSLGHYYHLLIDYKRVPAVTRAAIDAATSLHKDAAVLKRLDALTREHRNAGTHPEPYPNSKLFELLNALYKEGFMRGFLDAVEPAATSE